MPDKYIEDAIENTEEVVEEEVVEPTPDFATKEDFAKLEGMIEGLGASFKQFGAQPAPAPAPTGPSVEEKIS
ncbi:MAG: hypothetical protein GWN93_00670, partial [Deltaproteobacteria bacterium]|nr:hypothetical protein [Deltaproteobacteria bacterium]